MMSCYDVCMVGLALGLNTRGKIMSLTDKILWAVCFVLALMPACLIAALPLIYPYTYR